MVAVDVIYLSGYAAAAVKLECKRDTRKCVEVPVRDWEVTTKRIGERQTRKHPKIPSKETKEKAREDQQAKRTNLPRLKLVWYLDLLA